MEKRFGKRREERGREDDGRRTIRGWETGWKENRKKTER